MTVNVQSNKVTYTGNGSTTVFSFPFPAFSADDIDVYEYIISSKTLSVVSPANYTLSALPATSGTVTYAPGGSPLPSTKKLIIRRTVPFTQPLNILNQGGFFPNSIEDQFDKIVMQIQQLSEEVARSWKSQLGENAGNFKGVDTGANGQLLITDGSGNVIPSTNISTINQGISDNSQALAIEILNRIAGDEALASLIGGNYEPLERPDYDSLTALGLATVSVLRDGVTVGGYSEFGDCIPWRLKRVVSEPDHPGKKQSFDGAWWEYVVDEPWIEMFGGRADAVTTGSDWFRPTAISSGTDNVQPFYDMMDYLRARYGSLGTNPVAACKFGGIGTYQMSTHVNVYLAVHIKCLVTAGMAGPNGQRIVVPEGNTAFWFQGSNTVDNTILSPAGVHASSGSIYEGPPLACCGTPEAPDAANMWACLSNGIRMRRRIEVRQPRITNFGIGIHINATNLSDGTIDTDQERSIEGNANYWRVSGGRIEFNVYGMHVNGADANGGWCIGTEFNSNLIAGVWDDSFLGNAYIGCGTDGNKSAEYPSHCWHNDGTGGAVYVVVDAVLASTTEPTRNTSWPRVPMSLNPALIPNPAWAFKNTSSASDPGEPTAPAWVSGMTWYKGGGFILTGDVNNSKVVWGYSESNQAASYCEGQASIDGGPMQVMGPGPINLNFSIANMASIQSELFKTDGSGALLEQQRLFNRSTGNNRLQRVSFVNNYLTDGFTERVMATIDGGINTSGNPTVKFRGNTLADANTFADLLDIEGGSVKRTLPGGDNLMQLGLSTRRFLEAFITTLHVGAGTVLITAGTGTPEGTITAPVGSLYLRTDGGAGSTFYVKESGAGNTGWVGK